MAKIFTVATVECVVSIARGNDGQLNHGELDIVGPTPVNENGLLREWADAGSLSSERLRNSISWIAKFANAQAVRVRGRSNWVVRNSDTAPI